MKLLFFLCLTGFVPVTITIPQTTYAVYFVQSAMSWPAAQNYCRMKYTDMARDKYSSIMPMLINIAASKGLTTWPLWIGLFNDFDSWRWSFNSLSLKSTTLTNWLFGQPDNYKGKQACGGILTSGYWDDFVCADLKPFICYNAGNSGADRFVGISNPRLNWTDAQTYCRTFHTDLASALNQADNDLLAQVASVQGTSWFGLYRDTWKWLNRTVASNINWKPGQPDNLYPQENCASLQNEMIIDEKCSVRHYFFCEFVPPVIQQVVKLQVMSDEKVFDPAVQKSITDLINQKLEKHGMLKNTTVTWRVQPDGNIFYKKNKDD